MAIEKKTTTYGAAAHRGDEAAPPAPPQPKAKGAPRSDDDILQDVRDCLSGMIDGASGIEVEVSDAIVTLRGRVYDPVVARRTEEIVRGVRGVTSVTNRLSIELEQRAGDGRGPGRPSDGSASR